MKLLLQILLAGVMTLAGQTDPPEKKEPKTEVAKPGEPKPASPSKSETPPDAKKKEESKPVVLVDGRITEKALSALTMLLVVAVLLENAFALLFSWRVFLTYFNLRGWKTVIMYGTAQLLVHLYNLDIVADLIAAFRDSPPVHTWLSYGLTALILAGGSTAVNNIMTALGLRSAPPAQPSKPPADKAWVSVRLHRDKAVGKVEVRILDNGPAVAGSPAPIAGMAGTRPPSLLEMFFRIPDRFPSSGGHLVLPGHVYVISVADANGQTQPVGTFVFAPGAIVDFEVTL